MATEQRTAALPGSVSIAEWGSWLAALLGLWVLISPFVLDGPIGEPPVLYSNVAAGLLVLVLGAYAAYAIRSAVETEPNTPAEVGGWVAALAGLWIAVSPFVLTGAVGAGVPMWSTVAAGAIAFALAAYAGYDLRSTA